MKMGKRDLAADEKGDKGDQEAHDPLDPPKAGKIKNDEKRGNICPIECFHKNLLVFYYNVRAVFNQV